MERTQDKGFKGVNIYFLLANYSVLHCYDANCMWLQLSPDQGHSLLNYAAWWKCISFNAIYIYYLAFQQESFEHIERNIMFVQACRLSLEIICTRGFRHLFILGFRWYFNQIYSLTQGPLPLRDDNGIVLLGERAAKCRAYAKALHYKELEFQKGPSPLILESLIR